MARSLAEISREIYADWKKVSPHAEPYLDAMSTLDSIDDKYGQDSGQSIVAYFLSNAQSWKGENAKRIKKELNAMLKENEEFSIDESKKEPFLLYTNPNNVTNRAYVAIGANDVREVLKSARKYEDSYQILYRGRGTNDDLKKAKEMHSNYKFDDSKTIAESNDEFSIMEIYENGQVLSFEEYELYESLNETAGLEVEVETETPEEIVVRINGGIYTYKDSGKGVDGKGEPIPFSEVVRKFKKMKTYSDGRALQYLIKNTKMVNKKKVEKEDAKV